MKLIATLKVSERMACRFVRQLRTTHRYRPVVDPERLRVRERIIELATPYSRFGYKTITSMLQLKEFGVDRDAVYRAGAKRGCRFRRSNPSVQDYGLPMAPASGFVHSIEITFGVTTLCQSKRMTERGLGY